MEYNITCPRCKEAILQKHKTGIIEIYFWHKTSLKLKDLKNCKSLKEVMEKFNQREEAKRIYEFHYIKCPECDYFDIYEYREIETWDQNKNYLKKQFIKGDVVYDWKYGANSEIYIRSKVIQW